MKKFITFFFLFFVCLILGTEQVNAENIKFVQIADVHLSVDSEFSQKVLKSAIDDINTMSDVSFVVFTGDCIASPKEENLRTFVKIARRLHVPFYVALGNHDVYKSGGLSKVRYYELLREGRPLYPQRTPNYEFKKGDFVFLMVDGAKEVIPGSAGYYREKTLNWVDDRLSDNKKKNVVIFQHFPVEYPEGVESQLRTHKTYKVEAYQDLLDKHKNVLAVVTGHFHVNSENMKDGVYHISSPSILSMPNAYKIIDIIVTKEFSPIIYSQLREFEVKD